MNLKFYHLIFYKFINGDQTNILIFQKRDIKDIIKTSFKNILVKLN